MRFAVVSDIHGNLPALEAVIDAIRAEGIEDVVNLGDCISGPLWPAATGKRLMDLDWPTIAGNHERQLLTQTADEMGSADRAAQAELTPELRQWIGSLPPTLQYRDDVLLCHGTPTSDKAKWLHRGKRGSMRQAIDEEIAAEATAFAVTFCGHTHLPRSVQLRDGRIVANPGSVGLPSYEQHHDSFDESSASPDARFLVAEKRETAWSIRLIAVPYDYEAAARKAEAAGRPTWAQSLRFGRPS